MPATEEYIHKQFEGFQLTHELSTNAASRTFLAERISSSVQKDHVIVKWFYATPFTTPLKKKLFLQSALLLKQLHHPHIIPFLSAGIDAETNTPYTITTYATGGSLFDRLQQQDIPPFSMEEAQSVIGQIGQALSYAHLNNLIHGNLKPHNIFFVMHNEVRITDFALLLPFSSANWTINTTRELHYTAPELLAGGISKDGDQYALASIAYELLTGRKPFETPSVNAPGTFYKTRSVISPQRLNPDISNEADTAILKALAREPLERYANIRHFLRDLGIPLEATQQTATITFATEIVPSPQTPPLHSYLRQSELIEPSMPSILQDVVLITPDLDPEPEPDFYDDAPFTLPEMPEEITSEMLAAAPILSTAATALTPDLTEEPLATTMQNPANPPIFMQETTTIAPVAPQELSDQVTVAMAPQSSDMLPLNAEDLPTLALSLPIIAEQNAPVNLITTAARVQEARQVRDGMLTQKRRRPSALTLFSLVTLAIILLGILIGIFLPPYLQRTPAKATVTTTNVLHLNVTTKRQPTATPTAEPPSPQPPTPTTIVTAPTVITTNANQSVPPAATIPVIAPAPPTSPPATAAPTAPPTQPVPTPTPTSTTSANFTVTPLSLTSNNCNDQGQFLICTVTLSLGSAAPKTVNWYAYPNGMNARLSTYNGSLNPGQSQQVTLGIYNNCDNHGSIIFNANQTNFSVKQVC